MCGFVVMISKSGRPVPAERIERMSEDIRHRGPDDSGEWLTDWCGIGFRRLSIMDLSAHGHQPMWDSTGTFVIAYNGEVYNADDLRKQLASEGVVFNSTSDTEVVLHSYIRWGAGCVSRFIGMFAFTIVNVRTHELFIARDHLGIKPLYYTETKDFLILSSEIKSFRNVIKFELNHDVLYEQMVHQFVAGPNTPFKGVYKFPAGSYWSLREGEEPRRTKYYDIIDSLDRRNTVDETTLLQQVENSLTASIQLHTASDVGYTVQLSGGVDSSFITAVLARDLGERLETFSIALKDSPYDESKYQRLVADTFGTHHHELVFGGQEFADSLEKATWHMDVPIAHSSSVLLMRLCQRSVDTSKVILTGEGADELFLGYSRYEKLRDEPWSPGGTVASVLRAMHTSPRLLPGIRPFRRYRAQLASRVTDAPRTLKRPVMEAFLHDVPESIPYRDSVVATQHSAVLQALAHDQKCFLESLLDRQDKMSMAASVEARVPFCNPLLFDQINPVPVALKLKNQVPKYLLKKIGERYLDNDLLYRRKNGFWLPVDEWLRDGPLSDRLSLLNDQTARERGFYDNRRIDRAIKRFQRGDLIPGRYLVSILMFEIWMRMFVDNGAKAPA